MARHKILARGYLACIQVSAYSAQHTISAGNGGNVSEATTSDRLLLADSVEKVGLAAACRSGVPAVEVT
ncbi:hypothetical protein OLN11_32860, partial [Pseudomonas aeruginosa]|uniref:hypothetical protein n=1 Tax=Pseudomonas aeruginosa TaxID=287 RepID=UPI00249802BB